MTKGVVMDDVRRVMRSVAVVVVTMLWCGGGGGGGVVEVLRGKRLLKEGSADGRNTFRQTALRNRRKRRRQNLPEPATSVTHSLIS